MNQLKALSCKCGAGISYGKCVAGCENEAETSNSVPAMVFLIVMVIIGVLLTG